MTDDCEICGSICYPKTYRWEKLNEKNLCLYCFLWFANKHIIDESLADDSINSK